MKYNEEETSSRISSEKTNTSSFRDDTFTQEVNNPLFPKIRPRAGAKALSNSVNPGHTTVYIPSSKIEELNKNKNSIYEQSKINISEKIQINDKALNTKKLKSDKRLSKQNTINFSSPANEFLKTTLEQQNFMDSNEANFGITLNSLDEHWKYQKILLDYNILDFTMTYEMCQIIKKTGDPKDFERILSYLLPSIETKIEQYKTEPNFNNLSLIQNYVGFFMILALNLKQFPSFVKLIFEGPNKFFKTLTNMILKIKNSKKKRLLGILNNLFFSEYKDLYFNRGEPDLEKLFIEQQYEFSKKYLETVTFYDEPTYKKMFNILSDFDISYQNFFTYNNKIKDEEKPAYKLCIAQSLIRVAFSKEKKKYYLGKDEYYEYNLLKKIIDKDMEETVAKFGDEYKTLFRKEDLCDDVIKYMFFIFGNSMLIESFVKPLKKMLNKIGLTEDVINNKDPIAMKRDIKKDEFEALVCEIIDTLSSKIPDVLRILLKLLYDSVNEHFTIEKDNYGPLYTSLIFNFLISPRIQMLYSVNPLNCVFIRDLNRLLRNTCFNFKFAETDKLSIFNDIIDKNNKKMKDFINEKIISITINDNVKNSLRDLFTEKYLIYPKFLFYWDSQLLCGTITGGVDKMINFEELKSRNSWSFDKAPENI